ncbi:TerB family tellurite resistance protein [Sungkyunkwania multivorans]|uniref:TerB family tellurite resistance protein n=1 Tax=Sungkyunkwania multivorans TaxID=1173618 RepID=A0ABW3CWI0_9FLAO
MSIIDLFESSEHRNNLAHFATIVNLANIDGSINKEEEAHIKRLAEKLNITSSEYEEVFEHPEGYPVTAQNELHERLKRIFDFFRIVYTDHKIESSEKKLLFQYAIGLGFTESKAKDIINRSIRLFEGDIDFEEYSCFLEKS